MCSDGNRYGQALFPQKEIDHVRTIVIAHPAQLSSRLSSACALGLVLLASFRFAQTVPGADAQASVISLLRTTPKMMPPGSERAAVGGSSWGSDPTQGAPGQAQRVRFERVIGKQLDGLYRSALRLTRNQAAAEDLVQEVMLKSWRYFHAFQEGTSSRAWLHRILMNAFFDAYRKQTREPELVDHEDIGDFYLYDKATAGAALSEAGNPEALLEQIMDSEVRQSLEALPAQYRAAVLLADVEGFSYKEIADILSIPEGTVMSRLSRGRHLLQRKLWEFAKDRHLVRGDGH